MSDLVQSALLSLSAPVGKVVDGIEDDCLSASLAVYMVVCFYFATSFFVTAIGLDRFISINHPFIYLRLMSK